MAVGCGGGTSSGVGDNGCRDLPVLDVLTVLAG